MKPVDQAHLNHGQEGAENGDCFRACVASVMERAVEDVPHFCSKENESSWWDILVDWLDLEGWACVLVEAKNDADEPFRWPYFPNSVYYLAGGMSPRGFLHSVVYRDCKMVHDPHPSRDGIDPKTVHDLIFLFPKQPE